MALIILGSRLHQVDKEAGFLQVILNTWFRESVPHPMAATAGKSPNASGQRAKPPMLTEQAQRTLLAFREDVRYFYSNAYFLFNLIAFNRDEYKVQFKK